MPGPVPKRSDQRRRRNDKGEESEAAGAVEVPVPEPDSDWHPVARQWFESLRDSGQSAFYEPSDWATAVVLAESMSRELSAQPVVVASGKEATVEMLTLPPKSASIAAWLKGFTALLSTEGDRRRMSIELKRPVAEKGDDDVAWLDDARLRLRGESG